MEVPHTFELLCRDIPYRDHDFMTLRFELLSYRWYLEQVTFIGCVRQLSFLVIGLPANL